MPADFDLQSVEQGITGTRFAGRVHHFRSVGSTNQLAARAGQAGVEWGAWIADEQTAGRGRGGHSWHSAPGEGIYLSALVTPWVPMSFARDLPLLAGLAAREAVRECTGLEVDLRWPNDLMFGDRKCGGVLVESVSGAEGSAPEAPAGPSLRYAVLGIGLNVSHARFPAELGRVATSLLMESSRHFDREPIVASLLRQIDAEMKGLCSDRQGVPMRREPHQRFADASSWVSGKRVRVGEEDGYTGWTRGLDGQGFLLVEDDTGAIRTVLSGGVRGA